MELSDEKLQKSYKIHSVFCSLFAQLGNHAAWMTMWKLSLAISVILLGACDCVIVPHSGKSKGDQHGLCDEYDLFDPTRRIVTEGPWSWTSDADYEHLAQLAIEQLNSELGPADGRRNKWVLIRLESYRRGVDGKTVLTVLQGESRCRNDRTLVTSLMKCPLKEDGKVCPFSSVDKFPLELIIYYTSKLQPFCEYAYHKSAEKNGLRQQSIRHYSRFPDAFVERALRLCKTHELRVIGRSRYSICIIMFETKIFLADLKMVLEQDVSFRSWWHGSREYLWLYIDWFCTRIMVSAKGVPKLPKLRLPRQSQSFATDKNAPRWKTKAPCILCASHSECGVCRALRLMSEQRGWHTAPLFFSVAQFCQWRSFVIVLVRSLLKQPN